MAVDLAYYEALGVPPDASSAQIRKAYYQRARLCHPDKHPGDPSKEAEFKVLSEAYQTLFDDERRAAYDAYGRSGIHSGSYSDARQVFAAVFGGPEFEPWVGSLASSVDEALQQRADTAGKRVAAKSEELRGLQAAQAHPSLVEECRLELAALQAAHREAKKAVKSAMEELQRQRVQSCADVLRQRIHPFVTATLRGDGASARQQLVAEMTAELNRLRKCSMGEEMLRAIGYAYVRQTSKIRGRNATGAARLGGVFEGMLEGAHHLSEGAAAVGSVVSMANALSKLARDAKEGAPAEHKLSDAQRAELTDRVQKRTLSLVWAITKHSIETTLRSVVDELLLPAQGTASRRMATFRCPAGARPGSTVKVVHDGQTFAVLVPPGVGEGQPFDAPLPLPAAPAPGLSPAEFNARAEAIVLIGGLFSGEKPHEIPPAVEQAGEAINRMAHKGFEQASSTFSQLMGGLRSHINAATSSTPETTAARNSISY